MRRREKTDGEMRSGMRAPEAWGQATGPGLNSSHRSSD